MSALAPTLQAFFTDRLIRQRQASPQTIAAFRDTWRLLVAFAAERTGSEPSRLDVGDLDATLVGAFLDHLERKRGNGVRTRNARLAAIRSLFRYAALRHPRTRRVDQPGAGHPAQALRPQPRHVPRRARDRRTPRRSRPDDLDRTAGSRPAARRGPDRAAGVRAHRPALRGCPSRSGCPPRLPRQGPQGADHATHPHDGRGPARLARRASRQSRAPAIPDRHRHAAQPGRRRAPDREVRGSRGVVCPTLRTKRISPHVLRHTAAMRLLQADVDTSVIALWLGHERVDTTQIYLHADLALKERALARTVVKRFPLISGS